VAAATTTAATMMEASTIAVVAMATMPATEEAMVTAMAAVRLGESCYFFVTGLARFLPEIISGSRYDRNL
jgi:hypothetical protein